MSTEGWELWYVLPNVDIRKPVEAGPLAHVPSSDPRLKRIAKTSEADRLLLSGFSDQHGHSITPSAIIGRADCPRHLRREKAVVAFRNCIALAAVAQCVTQRMGGAIWPCFSDVFDLYPMSICNDGSFSVKSPALDFNGHPNGFRGQCAAHLPFASNVDISSDQEYLIVLLRQWSRRFERGRMEWRTKALFRSLEMAYQAASCPAMNRATLYDYGTLVALWVSAFECLVHPGRGREVRFRDVADFLQDVTYDWDPSRGGRYWPFDTLLARRYTVHSGRAKPKTNLLVKLYKQLYDARNHLLHGNRVVKSRLYAFGRRDRPHLLRLAPIMYRFAVLARFPLPRRLVRAYRANINQQVYNRTAQERLLEAAGQSD